MCVNLCMMCLLWCFCLGYLDGEERGDGCGYELDIIYVLFFGLFVR